MFLIPSICLSQSNSFDSLKKLLPTLEVRSRIDCLNKLSAGYYINVLSETYRNVQTDTAIWFALQADNESVKIDYDKGIAEALLNFGEIARYRNDFSAAENYLLQSIPMFEKIQIRFGY